MCEFCLKHGEGKKWYLQAKNYSDDLLSDLRRRKFIGGICNCDRADCLAMRCTVTHGVPVMFRAEYVAAVDPDACAGCRQCMRVCQFGALSYSASNHKVAVDQRWCYGCGICRAVCPRNAVRLQDRRQVPAAANRW